MIAEVVALLMFIGPDIKEHRIQPKGMAQCLRHKRIAERQFTPNVQYKCVRSSAKLEEKELAELKEAKVALDRYKLAIGDLELQKKSLT